MPRSKIDPREFVHCWQTSNALAEVAVRFGITGKKASAIAAHYRSQGVPLKKMPHAGGRKARNWGDLATYAESLAGK